MTSSDGEESNVNAEEIVAEVRACGDDAVRKYTRRWDADIEEFRVTSDERTEGLKSLPTADEAALRESAERIERFHRFQLPEKWKREFPEGFEAGELIRPINHVGCYVPGGGVPLASTLLMTVIPARVAGVEEITVCSPPDDDGTVPRAVRAAAEIAGADRLFSIGGAQAIAAMAYGTETVPDVDKIVGPGNKHVVEAKRAVHGDVAIDFLAGPSEVLIVSDGSNDPAVLAADLLAQAEHDTDARAELVTVSEQEEAAVRAAVEEQLSELAEESEISADTAGEAWESNGRIEVVSDLNEALEHANEIAPEHLELQTESPEDLLGEVRNAGTVFVGSWSPEVLGDYTTGTNHVLPTGTAARYTGGLSVRHFVKQITFEAHNTESLKNLAGAAKTLADLESLPAHRRSIEKREARLESEQNHESVDGS